MAEVGSYLCLHRSSVKRHAADGLLYFIQYRYQPWYVSEYELGRFLANAIGNDVAGKTRVMHQ